MTMLATLAAVSTLGAFNGPIFALDLFMNDPKAGWQATGYPEYMQHSAANYTNVVGMSFIQPADLMNATYDLPPKVGAAVKQIRKQGVVVQLLVGGEISKGWSELYANPQQAAKKAIEIMKKYDCGIEIDDEAGGDAKALVTFLKLCAAGKPAGTHLSIDVSGTPGGVQVETVKGALDVLDWINLMVSTPIYDQGNSVGYAHDAGFPYDKIIVAYFAGTWVKNCDTIGSATNVGDTAAGLKLVSAHNLKGLSIWAVGGASYGGCGTTSAPGFAQAMKALGAHN